MSASEKVRKVLRSHYCRMVGEDPVDGGWAPDDDTIDRIKEEAALLSNGDVKTFLEVALTAFIMRTGGGVNRHCSSPFFVNSSLCSEKNLTYAEKHYDRILLAINSLTSVETFSGLMRGEVLAGEILWLEGRISTERPDLESLRPPVHWILASLLLERLTKEELPECWFVGTCTSITDLGHERPIKEAFEAERQRIRSNSVMREALREAAHDAISEATFSWLAMHRLASLIRSREVGEKWCLVGAPEEWCRRMENAIQPRVPLRKRDSLVRSLAVERARELGKPVADHSQVAMKIESTAAGPNDSLLSGFVAAARRINEED